MLFILQLPSAGCHPIGAVFGLLDFAGTSVDEQELEELRPDLDNFRESPLPRCTFEDLICHQMVRAVTHSMLVMSLLQAPRPAP